MSYEEEAREGMRGAHDRSGCAWGAGDPWGAEAWAANCELGAPMEVDNNKEKAPCTGCTCQRDVPDAFPRKAWRHEGLTGTCIVLGRDCRPPSSPVIWASAQSSQTQQFSARAEEITFSFAAIEFFPHFSWPPGISSVGKAPPFFAPALFLS